MIRGLRDFLRREDGGTAAEFAFVLPVLTLFLLGIIDVGRLMWTWNEAEKATQMGVRYAVVTDMVPTGLKNYSFATSGGILQGEPIPTAAFDTVTCTSSSCSCSGTNCPTVWTTSPNTTAFNRIVDRMKLFLPVIEYSDVEVEYANSGLGYAGDPNGSDVAPLVKVSLRPNTITFQPIMTMAFGGSITLPDFSASLTLEDGEGTTSN